MKINIELPAIMPAVNNLPFKGTNPRGESISVNSRYFEKDGKPWLPVMGEFHFSRCRPEMWETELRKMMAGGIDIVATYVFWIHHEEEKGVWDFSGQRCLKEFIAACKKLNFPLILRIGPWAHGECRNGGFPDWLQNDVSFEKRVNDPQYLALVKILYGKIYDEAQGKLWQDGGPIIGIQLENEYGHCGGPNDERGMEHMKTLKKLAVDVGFTVPLYTATAWGGAVVVDGEMLPMVGGYVDAPWDQGLEELPENPNFLFQTALNDPLIGSDHKRDDTGHEFTCKINDYPYATAELGGGMQPTEHRRVVAFPKDTEALALCKLGSGANLLGYYMYHGGTNPQGRLSTLQESRATGYPNDVPIKSYDFEAPIGECLRISESYGLLKRIHLFLREWGCILAPAAAVIPTEGCKNAADLQTLRISARHNAQENCGFVFINNHMRKREMPPHKNVEISLKSSDLELDLPKLSVNSGDSLILPYNLPMGDCVLESTNAVPLTRLGKRYFFYCGEEPVYNFKGKAADITTLTPQEAANAYALCGKLYISPMPLFEENGLITVQAEGTVTVKVYGEAGQCKTIDVSPPKSQASSSFTKTGDGEYSLSINYGGELDDCILTLDYLGDKAELYTDGELAADWFTTGLPFNTSLKALNFPQEIRVKIYPSVKERYFDIKPESGFELRGCHLIPVNFIHLDL